MTANRPQVGISLLVVFDNSVLLGKRLGSHGAGEYGTPGGHMEHGEAFHEAALRELAEECGDSVIVTRPKVIRVTNLRTYLPKHYVDVGLVAHWCGGEAETMEPDKCAGWDFYPIGALPSPRFAAVDSLIDAYRSGRIGFEN